VNSELKQIKSQLADFEAIAKAEDEKAAIDVVNKLRGTHRKMEEHRAAMAAAGMEEMQEEKAKIDEGITQLKAGLTQLQMKLKSGPSRKAG
jgi:hypothetical protein